MRGQISKFVDFYPSSVTEIGSEVPISVTASPQGEAFGRSRATTVNYNFPFLARFSICPDLTTGTLGSLTSQFGASFSSLLMIFPPFAPIFRTR